MLTSFVLLALWVADGFAQSIPLDLSPRETELLAEWKNAHEAFANHMANAREQFVLIDVHEQLAKVQPRVISVPTPPPAIPPQVTEFNVARAKAEAGDLQAELQLASMYDNGLGVEPDSFEAFRWWKKAAEKGSPVAQYNVAVMYAAGQGVARNYPEAVEWYRKAAAQGWPDAYANLGWLYNAGRGVPANKAEARSLWNKGAELGSFKAKIGLSSVNQRVVVGDEPGSFFYLLDDGVCCGQEISNPKEHQAYLAQLQQEEEERQRREEQKRRFAQRLAQREAAALVARNLETERRAAARTGAYVVPSDGHWIDQLYRGGELVRLEDGSTWRVSPIDVMTSRNWSATSEITVEEGNELLYPYLLVNTDDNEVVNARLLNR